jgi:MFS family permease
MAPRQRKNVVLAAMVFAVAMTFIDQTIVAIAVPDLQRDLSLSATGSQWIINGYLLSLQPEPAQETVVPAAAGAP